VFSFHLTILKHERIHLCYTLTILNQVFPVKDVKRL